MPLLVATFIVPEPLLFHPVGAGRRDSGANQPLPHMVCADHRGVSTGAPQVAAASDRTDLSDPSDEPEPARPRVAQFLEAGILEKMATTSATTEPDRADLSDLLNAVTDPVERLLLTGRARTVHEAEEMYLDSAYPQVLALLEGPLSNEDLGRHPLLLMYRSHGSRPREDSLL
jgi:hypothetical protein